MRFSELLQRLGISQSASLSGEPSKDMAASDQTSNSALDTASRRHHPALQARPEDTVGEPLPPAPYPARRPVPADPAQSISHLQSAADHGSISAHPARSNAYRSPVLSPAQPQPHG